MPKERLSWFPPEIPSFEPNALTKGTIRNLLHARDGRIELSDGRKISVIDLIDAPQEFVRILNNESDALPLINRILGLEPEVWDGGDKEKELYERLGASIRAANTFLKDALHVPSGLAYADEDVPSITTRKELLEFLRSVTLFEKGSKNPQQATRAHLRNCGIVLASIAAYELGKRDIQQLLQADATTLDKVLCRGGALEDGGAPVEALFGDDYLESAGGGNGGRRRKVVMLDSRPPLQMDLSLRAKSPLSLMMKFLGKVDANADEALKDGIGMRFELKDSNAVLQMTTHTVKYLTKELGATGISIKVAGAALDEQQLDVLKSELGDVTDKDEGPIRFPRQTNTITNTRYRDVKILASVIINGELRSIEIQLFDEDNKNESGLRNHYVYDLAKRVRVFTRLYGRCPESWFNEMLYKAAQDSGLSADHIRTYLLENKIIIPAPSGGRQKSRRGYLSTAVYEQLCPSESSYKENPNQVMLTPLEYCKAYWHALE